MLAFARSESMFGIGLKGACRRRQPFLDDFGMSAFEGFEHFGIDFCRVGELTDILPVSGILIPLCLSLRRRFDPTVVIDRGAGMSRSRISSLFVSVEHDEKHSFRTPGRNRVA